MRVMLMIMGDPEPGAAPSEELLQVQSMDEAVEWAKRAPFEALSRIYPGEYGATGEIEIRRVFELEGLDAST